MAVEPVADRVEVVLEQGRIHVEGSWRRCGGEASAVRTGLTVAPEAIASDAALCRRSCGVSPSISVAERAGSHTRRRQLASRTLHSWVGRTCTSIPR
jgi:hypothetical protein